MTRGKLLIHNLLYHWRGNLAVLLGVVVGTAVLTGALLVGDSLRGSLRELALEQLGWVDEALVAGRFFRAEVAAALPAQRICPALLLQGTAEAGNRRASKVTIIGIDDRFWPTTSGPAEMQFWRSDNKEGVLNAALASVLHAEVGSQITLNVQKADNIPRESLLGKRQADDVLQALTITVNRILPNKGLARFTLKPSPEPVRNIFLPLQFLQERLDLKGKANALLVGGAAPRLQQELHPALTLDDWNLMLWTPTQRAERLLRVLDPRNRDGVVKAAKWKGRVPDDVAKVARGDGSLSLPQITQVYQQKRAYLSLESRRLFVEPVVETAALKAAQRVGLAVTPTLVYLADTLADSKGEVPYAVVAAVPPTTRGAQMLLADVPIAGDDDIVLVDWPEARLAGKTGERLTLSYFRPDDHGQLKKIQQVFREAGKVPLQGPWDDPDLTPEFPGITDKTDIRDWENPPFDFKPKRIQKPDEDYWKRYRTTPKAYVTLATGQKLWGSRFGNVTALRLALTEPAQNLDQLAKDFTKALLHELRPDQGGFVFDKVKDQALRAGTGAVDFGQYFLGFSFFLIAAALLLVGLLFRLNLDRRAAEIGLLLAVGWRRRGVRWLLLAEGGLLAAVGAALGLAGALWYGDLLLGLLRVRWPDGQDLTFLQLYATPLSLLIGYVSSLLVSLLTILWAMRTLSRVSPRGLLAGETTIPVPAVARGRRPWSIWIGAISTAGALICLIVGATATAHQTLAMSFFVSGMLLLTSCLAGVWAWLGGSRHEMITHGKAAVARLGVRNASRHAVRSVLTIGLLASATFLVVAVESFHRQADQEFFEKTGGSGGFPLLAESEVPLYQDLNDPNTRADLNIPDESSPLWQKVTVYPCRFRGGDDASCLNLYQPLRPRLLGVSPALMERGGFRFKATLAQAAEEKTNPWLLLDQPLEDKSIPVFVDGNSAQWILKVGLGDSLEVPDEKGVKRPLRVVGLFQESIFQSELVMSAANFEKLYPRQEGFQFFLIDCPPAEANTVKTILEKALALQGVNVTPTAQRLEAFLAVENTYLATFQALGGLGLLLGALGLAVVLVRTVWERRGELALLRALGFRRNLLSWLVLAENLFLLLMGLAVGTLAAVLAVSPHLLSGEGHLLWLQLAGLLAVVSVVGLVSAMVATATTLRAPLLPALRRE